jgi:hypothetical protein
MSQSSILRAAATFSTYRSRRRWRTARASLLMASDMNQITHADGTSAAASRSSRTGQSRSRPVPAPSVRPNVFM